MTGIVSDATALIVLAKLGRLDLLEKLFSRVIIPRQVLEEISLKAEYDLSVWQHGLFEIRENIQTEVCESLSGILDPGEGQAIAMAVQSGLPLIIDEKKGRSVARSMGIQVIGLVGMLLACHRGKFAGKDEIMDILIKAIDIGFRLSPRLHEEFSRSMELP